ncbi:MAG: hypothetical protein ABIS14_03795, partial [Sphingomonas sp.]
ALRVQQRALQAALIAPDSAEEERAAELKRDVADDTGDDALGTVVTSGTGTDADAGEYLNQAE